MFMQNAYSRPAGGSGRRIAIVSLGVIGITGVSLIGLWWTAAMRTPVVKIPTPVMPHPNAFDFYVKAGNAVTGDKQIGDAVSLKPTASLSLAQKEALVQQNANAIDTLHQGFAYPYVNPPCRSWDTLFPYYARFRGMTRLLSLRGKVRAAHGDWGGAMESFQDAIRIGEDVPHGSPVIGALVGIACQAIGRRPMWKIVDHLNAAQSHAALDRLASTMARRLPFADTIQEEKWTGQAGMLEVFNNSKKQAALLNSSEAPNDVSAATARSLSSLFFLAYSKNKIMHNFTTYMDGYSQVAQQPYGRHPAPPALPTDPFNRSLVPIFSQARMKDIACETQNGLLLITLALHAFRLEHGRYPASLTELLPAYLKRLPEDPFGPGGTFKYRVKGKRYVLYSVGPDGKDDGGTPIDDPKKATSSNPNARYFVEPNSVGDIVVGTNQ
jgi:type II secretory pathway pseudopilin PulG